MQFPQSWLRSLVDPTLSTESLAHALTMAGLEVEALRAIAPPTSKVVVGQIREVVKHPDADRLNVCQVDVGAAELLTIVCGAPNVAVGCKVPCALIGAELPAAEAGGAPFRIKRSKLRGVESQGMLCSARELKISGDGVGLLILPADAPVGQDIRQALHLDEMVFDIKLTPNRADCLSILGIAREVSAITGAPLRQPQFESVRATLTEILPVKVAASDLCGRFSGRVMRHVNARAQTPKWMVERLERAGQRSISALIDISNYVMLELGQPTHIFDLDKLHGPLEVRWAQCGEALKLLNGNTVELDQTVGVIADQQAVQSMAGVMGGDHTAVSLDTCNIYLEAAFWWPDSIRGRARRYNFATEAAHRFERGVDYAATVAQLEYMTRLVVDICGGEAGPIDDQVIALPERAPVALDATRASRIIGVNISVNEIAEIFTRLGLPFEFQDEQFIVTPPSYRFDLEIEADLVEEVARIYGFEKIPARLPVALNIMREATETRRSVHAIRHQLAALGYTETINFSFVDEAWEQDFAGNAAPVRVLNPIASQLSVMRSTLLGGLVNQLSYNLKRKAAQIRLFEVGRAFSLDPAAPAGDLTVAGLNQQSLVSALAYGPVWPEQWGVATRWVDFFDLKSDLEALFAPATPRFTAAKHPALHPGRSAQIELAGKQVGWLGELHPRWLQKYDLPRAPIFFEINLNALCERTVPTALEVAKFPPVRRDIAVLVSAQIKAQELLDEMQKARADEACKYVQQITLFDEFRPQVETDAQLPQQRSLAFRITLQDTEGTLQDAMIDLAIKTLVDRLVRIYDVRLRN
ncbi:MAG: phenylalanyl-tRNA synthetase beta subunit [Glomeribacter sp. 1016415]|nr:phenylalanyl-tRNA synthetase beta subunit [Glomeribacter sp. 1016415]